MHNANAIHAGGILYAAPRYIPNFLMVLLEMCNTLRRLIIVFEKADFVTYIICKAVVQYFITKSML